MLYFYLKNLLAFVKSDGVLISIDCFLGEAFVSYNLTFIPNSKNLFISKSSTYSKNVLLVVLPNLVISFLGNEKYNDVYMMRQNYYICSQG